MSNPKEKAVIILSGGQDSCTSLAMMAAPESSVEVIGAIHFNYGQQHSIELECARVWADDYNIPLEVVPISSLGKVAESALLSGQDDYTVNESHPKLKQLPASFVPGRNLIFITLAAAYAMKIGASAVITGVCQTDYSGYPDCRQGTMDSLKETISLGMDFPEFEIITPIMYLSKAETFAAAADLGVLAKVINNTHTCYNGSRDTLNSWGYGCGVCPACEVRRHGYLQYLESLNSSASK